MTIDKKISYVEQDGVKNYVKNSPSITVPKKFKARKNAPAVKLAYITDAEAKMLKKKKKGTPHKGPKGIPSYDSFDADGNFTSGAAMSAAETGSRNQRDRAEVRASNIGGPKGLAPGVTSNEARDLRSAFIAAGGGQRVNPGFFDSRNVVSPAELARAKAFNPKAFRAGRKGSFLDLIKSGGIIGSLIRKIGQRLGFGKTYDQPTYDMRQFSDLGLLTDRVNPNYYLDQDNDDLLPITFTPKNVISVDDKITPLSINDKIAPLSIFDNQLVPMSAKADKGIIQALASATVPEIATDYVNQIERGEPITDDEQMFIDNEIANLRFP